ncbi:MAG: amidophosphoribosyltransferase, partial [Hyphomicrobiales bacterium]|nr:amidophosphoribosyltransferase [Hyphomicrobiales bacterium]
LDGATFHNERRFGLVGDNFTDRAVIERLPGDRAVGHVRYSTRGGPEERNIQPLFAGFSGGGFAVAHNGNITNALVLQDELQRRGSIFQSTCDTEVILHLIATSTHDRLVDRMISALSHVEGAWSLVCLSSKKMIGCRDPLGVRPLVLGRFDGAPILASETCALDIIGADFVRDVEPGEMVIITANGIESRRPFAPRRPRFCIFEYVYFSRPDSSVEGRGVYDVRKSIGAELAREASVPADLVVPVPDGGTPGAIGYAEAAGLPFDLGIIRNHYVGRTFIEPSDAIRHMGVKLKHNANRAILAGKRVVLIDDSIVRGTTSSKIVQMVRDAGASEVHLRIASPPTMHPCFYGVDTPDKTKLIASRLSVAEIADFIKVDSLRFLSLDGLYRALGESSRKDATPQFCDACFSGEYPTRLADRDRPGTDSELVPPFVSALAEAG